MASSVQLQKAEEGKDVSSRKPQLGARVRVNNAMLTEMKLNRSFSWAGGPSGGSFPANIGSGSFISFEHTRQGNFGSKAMVVYDTTNAAAEECSWVLAWDAPAETDVSPNKVYVLTGLKFDIDPLTPQEIQARLDNSGVRTVNRNPTTKTLAEATINDLIPNVATVGATFALAMP